MDCDLPCRQPVSTSPFLLQGLSFQIVDDLLDFVGTSLVLGKPALADLKEVRSPLHQTRAPRSLSSNVAFALCSSLGDCFFVPRR
jgi:hypothetical protein